MEDTNQTAPSKNKALPLFILLFLISLGLSAFLFFKYAKNAVTIQQQNEELKLSYEMLQLDQDSISKKLAIVEQQLQNRINEILAQEDLKEDLRQQLLEKSKALAAARSKIQRLIHSKEGIAASSGGPRNLLEAVNQIKQLQDSNATYLANAEDIQRKYIAAKKTAAKNEAIALRLSKEKDSIRTENTLLANRLEDASSLRVLEFAGTPIRERRGKIEPTDKASKVERLKFTFIVQESYLTEKEDKEIIIRILSPNGTVLAKNTNKLTDSKDIYSLKESITYDGTEKKITLYYDQEPEYINGSYTAELWNDEKIIGRKQFSLR